MTVAAAIIGYLAAFSWGLATSPIVKSVDATLLAIREERSARTAADSLLLTRVALLDEKFDIIGEALVLPAGSAEREVALAPLRRSSERRRFQRLR